MNEDCIYVLCGISPIGWHQNLMLCEFICLRGWGGWGRQRSFEILLSAAYADESLVS